MTPDPTTTPGMPAPLPFPAPDGLPRPATPRPASRAERSRPTLLARLRRRGARRWFWLLARAVGATAVVLAVITLVWPGLFGAWSARTGGAVPRSIELPWRWQASVEEDPPGLAAVVATADGPAPNASVPAPTAPDTGADATSPVQVIGRNGVYRAVYPSAGQWRAGTTLHLSPDGRYLALPYLHDPDTARFGPTLIDLTTGRTSVVDAVGLPEHSTLGVLAWRPDAGALLLAALTGRTAQMVLLDLATGSARTLAEMPAPADPQEWRVAFSPDGRRVAYMSDGSLHLVDEQGTAVWTVPLTEGRVLAGEGAFTPDGTRIAVVRPLPCPRTCAEAPPWAATYVDSANGKTARGPVLPTIEAAAVRAVGWTTHDDGSVSLVLVRYLPEPPATPAYAGPTGGGANQTAAPDPRDGQPGLPGPADLYELSAGEAPRLLLDAPYEVTDLDVSADLVRAGRFEGTPSMPSLLPIERGRVRPIDVGVAAAVVGALAAVVGVLVRLTGRPARLLLRRLLARGRRIVAPPQRQPSAGS
ncbi:MAG TPA: hypothetical protein VH561_17115 [Micromonosporaceae bacterium]|jgi:hypothetical protein